MKNVALVVAALAATAAATGCNPQRDIVHGLDEFEANQIMVVLEAKGISAEKLKEEGRVVTYSVSVGEVDMKDAMRLLVANHLPSERSESFDKVYPAGGGGLIPTKSEEKAKFMMALQGEIERKLKTYPGIVAAHVTIVQPEKDIIRGIDEAPPESKASVAIVFNSVDNERSTPIISEDEVRRLVSASVEDLKPENVKVVLKQNRPTPLVDVAADSGQTVEGVAAATWVGLRFADKKSLSHVQMYMALLAVFAVLGVAVAAGGIVRTQTMRRRAEKAQAELTSMRKAAKSTQTGLQQQQT